MSLSQSTYPSSIVTPFMMIEFVILTFSLIVVDVPMVERLMDVLSAIWLNAPMMLSPPTLER